RQINANLDNLGTVNINTNATLDKFAGTTTNQNSFNVATGVTLSVNSHTFTQMAGTLGMQGTGTFSMNSGTFNFGGGTVSGLAILLQSLLNNSASSGAATFNMQGQSSTLSGNIVAGETVIIEATPANHATVTAANSLTNSGEIRMIATGNPN